MIEAIRVRYSLGLFACGGFKDSSVSLPATLVYVPSERVLVDRDRKSNVILGPANSFCYALVDEIAEKTYEQHKKELERINCQFEKIEVTPEFIEWARALERSRREGKNITDIINPNL
jgi:hypothetical protein